MESPYGGYGLFYRGVLEDLGLTKLGAGDFIDKLTDLGAEAASSFREVIEPTRYWQQYADEQLVPFEVLRELGSAVCPCGIPGRADQTALLKVFFEPRAEGQWQQSRRYRVESLRLFLDFHADRPEGPARVSEWRRAILGGVFSDGSTWSLSASEIVDGWRAYQLRGTEALALSAIWVCFLTALDGLAGETRAGARDAVVDQVDWSAFGGEKVPVKRAIADARQAVGSVLDLLAVAERCQRVVDISDAATSALRVLLAMPEHGAGTEQFDVLLDEGGTERWSVRYFIDWLNHRREMPLRQAVGQLVDEMYFQHLRVATSKLSSTDHRDPFCVRDDNGSLRVLRLDEPLWTGGRFAPVNHLLWTLGLVTEPEGDIRPTDLARSNAIAADG